MPTGKEYERQTPLRSLSPDEIRTLRQAQVSRRWLLRRSGGVAAITVGSAAGAAAVAEPVMTQEEEATGAPFDYAFEGVPEIPDEPPARELQTFTEEEAAAVEALTARLLPGTPDDPGAREAGVVYYIDFLLSVNSGIHESTYTAGPYARAYEGDAPPEEDSEETIWVSADEIDRYGYQAPLSPLDVYRIALPLVEEHARTTFGSGVAGLSEEEQDQVIWDLLDEEVEGFDQFPSSAFFMTLRRHTAEGMFSDPAYGGNADLVGWKLVGFPGAQRGYAPADLLSDAEPRPPQAMSQMPHFNPGVRSHDDHPIVIQPVRDGEVDDEEQAGDE